MPRWNCGRKGIDSGAAGGQEAGVGSQNHAANGPRGSNPENSSGPVAAVSGRRAPNSAVNASPPANAPELAAWTMVSNVLLNLDETITKE